MNFTKIGKWDVEEQLTHQNGLVETNFLKDASGNYHCPIKINIHNPLDYKVFVSFIYLDMNFRIHPAMLQPSVVELEAGSTAYTWAGKPIPFKLGEQVRVFEMPASISYFQLLLSTEPFKVDYLQQDPLPIPTIKTARAAEAPAISFKDYAALSNWNSRLFTIKINNPN